jgi:hypothetical protein
VERRPSALRTLIRQLVQLRVPRVPLGRRVQPEARHNRRACVSMENISMPESVFIAHLARRVQVV